MNKKEVTYEIVNEFAIAIKCWYSSPHPAASNKSTASWPSTTASSSIGSKPRPASPHSTSQPSSSTTNNPTKSWNSSSTTEPTPTSKITTNKPSSSTSAEMANSNVSNYFSSKASTWRSRIYTDKHPSSMPRRKIDWTSFTNSLKRKVSPFLVSRHQPHR